MITKQCLKCNNPFESHKWQYRKYCSQSCYQQSNTMKENRRKNGLKCKNRKVTWGDKISKAKIGKPRPDMMGEKNWNYKDGKNKENRRWIMSTQKYKNWRRKVFERDNYTCRICGDKNGNGKTIKLIAHHIDHWSVNKKLRFEVDNGFTVCRNCHILGHQLFGF